MKSGMFLCIFILFFSVTMRAQEDTTALQRGTIYPGYIITQDNDTVEGWLLNINCWLNQHQTFFYNDPDNHKGRIKYTANELKEYKVGNRIYESIRFEGQYSSHKDNFFMRIITGPISYYLWYYDPDRSKLSPVSMTLNDISDALLFEENELSTQDLIRKLDGEMTNLGQLKYLVNFDKSMSKLVSDYPELAEKIKNKEDGYQWIDKEKIIREFNQWYLDNH